MDRANIEEKEICEINNKKYTVITRTAKECLDKDRLVKLICNYAMNELKQEDL